MRAADAPCALPSFRRRQFPAGRTLVLGILNVTPDSFSDGGRHADRDSALRHGLALVADGADLIDVGGESTRPGAWPVPVQEELDRVIPVVEALRANSDVLVSVDTSRPEVIAAAVAAGADMLNDVRALREPGALAAAVAAGVPVCLMHMRGEPGSMQLAPAYADVVAEVLGYLQERVATCVAAGLERASLILDPGFGFGKTLAHNLALLRALPAFAATGLPVMAGLSRKAMVGQLTGRPVGERMAGSIALALAARARGAGLLRVHDVRETVDALRVLEALERDEGGEE